MAYRQKKRKNVGKVDRTVVNGSSQRDEEPVTRYNEMNLGLKNDSFFLKIVDVYIKAVVRMKYLQSMTENSSYKLFSGTVSMVVLAVVGCRALLAYFHVLNALPNYRAQLISLNAVRNWSMGKSFLFKPKVIWLPNRECLFKRYEPLISFVGDDLIYLQVNFAEMDHLVATCLDLNIFTAVITLCLNIP